MSISKKVRVNLGCGKDYVDGWVNVDIEQSYKVDVIADLTKDFPFQDNSVDELKASDILEHFTKEDGIKFLTECHRVLKKNGIITLRTHNVYQIFKQFKKDPDVLVHFLYGNTEETGIFGAHKFGYTKKSITKVLSLIGFNIDSIENEQTNFKIIARKKEMKPKKKLTIAVIMQAPDIGGAETYMMKLMQQFFQNGHNLIFATNYQRLLTMIEYLPMKQYKLPFIIDFMGNLRGLIKSTLLLPYAIIYYSSLLHKMKKAKTDVILMSNFSEKLLVSFLSIFFHIPVVWIEYGPMRTIFKRNFYIPKVLYRLLRGIPQYVIVPSENTKRSLISDARVSLAKLLLVPCGIEIKNLKIDVRKKEKRFVIGNVSRLTTEKGQDYLIKAMPQVLKEIPHAQLVLVGDGPDYKTYEKLIADLHLEKNVFLKGFVQDTGNYYNTMDLFVFPTVWELEGFGLVLPEAMSRKIPVIGSNTGPVPEIIDNDFSGVLVPPKDEKAIAQAIIALYKDTRKRNKLAENGYQKAIELYDIEKVSKRILTILEDASFTAKTS